MSRALRNDGAQARLDELLESRIEENERDSKPLQRYYASVLIEGMSPLRFMELVAQSEYTEAGNVGHELSDELSGPTWVWSTWWYQARGANATDIERKVQGFLAGESVKNMMVDGLRVEHVE